MLIDTHCHLSFKAFNDDWQDAARRARQNDITMICVGAARATSEKSITIAKEDGVFASIGLHPTHAEDETFDRAWFSEHADNPKVVAIGETGIDHYHISDNSNVIPAKAGIQGQVQGTLDPRLRGGDGGSRAVILQKQEELLHQHLSLAKEKSLPVILHSRDGKHEQGGEAYEHLYRIIKDFGYFKCVLHCYVGDWGRAQKFLDLGCMISFTGIVTYKNAGQNLIEVVKNIPGDRYMIETDSPYLAPEPVRGTQNEPAYVEHVARGIAQIRGEDYDTVASQTTENAKRFFEI